MDASRLDSLCAEFLRYCRISQSHSAHTIAAYNQDLKELALYCSLDKFSAWAEPALVFGYVDYLQEQRSLMPASVRRRIACLRGFFKWLEKEKVIASSPFRGLDLQLKVPKRLPRTLSRSQVLAVTRIASPNPANEPDARERGGLAVRLLLSTGVRVSELTSIRLPDVAADGSGVRIVGKGKRERTVFVGNRRLRRDLLRYIEQRCTGSAESDHLFLNQRGRPLSPQTLRLRLRKISEQLKISPRVTPHRFRHTAATLLIEEGTDIRFVQRLLGHSSISTTEIYTHVSDNSLKSAVELADPLGKLGL